MRSMDVSLVLRTHLSSIPAFRITCHRLVYSYVPFPSYMFPLTCTCTDIDCRLVSGYLTVPCFPFYLVDSYTYMFSLMPLSFCSSSTRLSSRYSWTLTRYWVISPFCIFVLVSRILPIYTGWRCGLFPIFNLLCNHPKGVTCEIPRTLLVLSSSLAKATALRFLGVISSVYSLTGSEVQPMQCTSVCS